MAEASVRPAGPDDTPEIARIQLLTWRTAYADVAPAEVLSADDEDLRAAWSRAVPPPSGHHVLVAEENGVVVGFAAVEPDPDDAAAALIGSLLVEPRWGRRGHGSRLLAAVTDLLRADGRGIVRVWCLERDPASLGLFTAAGWRRDGWLRTLDADTGTVREVRLHVGLGEP